MRWTCIVTSDHQDRDGIPLPDGPLEEAPGGEVVSRRTSAGRRPRPVLPASELAVSSFGEVAARVAAAGEPRWLIEGIWPADAYGVLAALRAGGDMQTVQQLGDRLAEVGHKLKPRTIQLALGELGGR